MGPIACRVRQEMEEAWGESTPKQARIDDMQAAILIYQLHDEISRLGSC